MKRLKTIEDTVKAVFKKDKERTSFTDDCCVGCAYPCPVCGNCLCEDEESDRVLPSTEFDYPNSLVRWQLPAPMPLFSFLLIQLKLPPLFIFLLLTVGSFPKLLILLVLEL